MGKDGRKWLRIQEAEANRKRLLELREKLFAQAIEMALEEYQSAGIAIRTDYKNRMAGVDDE